MVFFRTRHNRWFVLNKQPCIFNIMKGNKMTLLKCPECGKNITDTRESCIHCGYKLNQNKTSSNTQKPAKKKGSIIGTIFWIIVMICIFRACSSTTETSTSNIKLKDTDKGFEDYFSTNPTLIKQCQSNYNNPNDASSCICKHFVIWFVEGEVFGNGQQSFAGKKLNSLYQESAQKFPAMADNLYQRCYKFSAKRLSNF